ncbi:MAG: Septum formation protein Maf [Ignavibacteria bacterium]|nr:Septum formation protein Maf [Ignavibacteria bacterium]
MKEQIVKISGLIGLKIPIVLASQSPRRQHLLERLGFQFTIEPAHIEENELENEEPSQHVMRLALEKARAIAKTKSVPALVIGADTIVFLEGAILNKPENKSDAIQMLSRLSGREHTVFSGVALVESCTRKSVVEYEKTLVEFRNLSDEEISAYVESGSPLDKAGAYGVQDDFGAVFVRRIEGCYYNVVGLPLQLLYLMMRDFCRDDSY